MRFSDSEKWLALAVGAGAAWLVYLLAPVLTPFVAGALLAYLGDPLVDRLERLGVSRTMGVVIVFAVMLLAGVGGVLILVPALQNQISVLIAKIPEVIDWLERWLLPHLSAQLGIELAIDAEALKQAVVDHWQALGTVARDVFSHLGRGGQVLLVWVTYLLLIPVVTFYLLRDWDALVESVRDLLPRSVEPRAVDLAREIDQVLAQFLRGQLTVMAALALIYTVGLWIVGLDLAFAIGMVAGLVSFVPYLGVIVGVLLAGMAAVLQFGDIWHLLGVVAVFSVGQALEGMVLSPLLVGDRIGLHPVAVIFAVLAGGQLFGFFGVLLALPAASVVVVLLRHSRDRYKRSDLYA